MIPRPFDELAVICRCLTPPGLAGLSVFQVEGQQAPAFLGVRVDRSLPLPGQLRLMRLIHDGEWVDEVLVAQPTLGVFEISTHGGIAVRAAVSRLLGMDDPGRQDDSLGCVVNRGIAADAMHALRSAWSPRAAEFFLALGSGALDEWILGLAVEVEKPGRRDFVRSVLRELIVRSTYGFAMARGVSVLLLGEPNAGKSTLANRLLGRERCIVTEEAGTTRDLVEEATSLLGYPFRLIDAAGVREACDAVEQEGVRRATAAAKQAGLRLFVVDGSRSEWDASVFDPSPQAGRALAVLTKRDLPNRLSVADVERRLRVPVVECSEGDEFGLARLRALLLYRSPFIRPQSPPILAPYLPAQVRSLEAALEHLERDNPSGACASLLSLVASGN